MKLRSPDWSLPTERLFVSAGAGSAILGLTILFGWYWNLAGLIRLFLPVTQMAPRTAVSFLCLGLGLAAFAGKRGRLSAALAIGVGVVHLLTLAEYAFGIDLALDRLLLLPNYALVTKAAPNTSVCFVFLSLALLLLCLRPFSGRSTWLGLLSSAASALAIASLAGYASSVRTFEWGQFKPMAPHTAAGLVLLGVAVFSFSWRDGRRRGDGAPPWLYLSASLFGVVLSVSLWQALAADSRDQARRAVAADLDSVRVDIVSQMRLRSALLTRAARRWEELGVPSQADWDFETGLLLSDLLDFRSIEWVEPDLRIRWVAPWKGNERLRDADLGFDLRRRAAFESARSQHRAVLTRTLDLLTGGRGIQILVPVFQRGACQGYVAGIFLVDELLPRLVPPTSAPGEQIAIYDGSEPIYSRATEDRRTERSWSQRIVIDLGGPQWTIEMAPSRKRLAELRTSTPETVLGSGLLLSILLGAAVFLAQQAARRARIAEDLRKAITKEADERLMAQRELDQFFALSLEMLGFVSMDGYFKRINPAFEHVLGFSLEELRSRPFLDFVQPEDRDRTIAAVQQLAAGRDLAGFENRYLARDGSIHWMQWACAPSPDRKTIIASARDVTETKAAQAALEQAHAELEDRVRDRTAALEESNRALARSEQSILHLNAELEGRIRELTAANQELEAFTYSVSHDLRAPLRHIDGFSKILLEDYLERIPEDARRLLERVRRGSQRMGRMVDELLELSRTARRDPDKRLTGLRALVDEVVSDLKSETTEREVEWRIGELPFADCDPTLTRQIFVNLISNALKFTRPRKRAVIEIGQTEADGAPAMYVRDNGVGFSMNYADKLFGAFQRLHRQEDFEGTGVGLATVQRIVHKHGGRIWAEAALDQGAAFFFTLGPPMGPAAGDRVDHEILEAHDVKK